MRYPPVAAVDGTAAGQLLLEKIRPQRARLAPFALAQCAASNRNATLTGKFAKTTSDA
jgi:hypothetical protein